MNRPYESMDPHERELYGMFTREMDVFKSLLDRLDRVLFGNGQKGVLASINERLDKLESYVDTRSAETAQRRLAFAEIVKIVGIIGGLVGIWAHIFGIVGAKH